jgi:membrane-bound lytic murein transglycosylase B
MLLTLIRSLALAALAVLTFGAPATLASPPTASPVGAQAQPKPKAKPKQASVRKPPALRTPAHTPGFGDPAHGGAAGDYGQRADVAAWAKAWAPTQGWQAEEVIALLAQARYQKRAAQLMMPAPVGVAKDWGAYRDRFVEPVRLQTGLRFWAQHADTLARAEKEYGVPASLIMGILGVETNYGQIMGNYRVLDALATLAFDFPGGRSDRTPFFREQLGEFLQLTRTEARDPTGFKGSFAGAMGYGQFMPGSWRAHAVDFDGDAHIDLIGNPVDAIGSIAHFLVDHGWQRGTPTHRWVDAPADPAARARLAQPDIDPTWTPDALRRAGVTLPPELDAHGHLAFIELENGGAERSHAVTSKNFWVVTRYNRSAYYAMGVIALGERLHALRTAGQP